MNWIELEHKKPEINQFCLVYRSYLDDNYYLNHLYGYAYYWGNDEWTIGSEVGQPWNPEYWLPIPDFPKR